MNQAGDDNCLMTARMNTAVYLRGFKEAQTRQRGGASALPLCYPPVKTTSGQLDPM